MTTSTSELTIEYEIHTGTGDPIRSQRKMSAYYYLDTDRADTLNLLNSGQTYIPIGGHIFKRDLITHVIMTDITPKKKETETNE